MTDAARSRLRAWTFLAVAFCFVLSSLSLAFDVSAFLRARGYLGSTVSLALGAAVVVLSYLLVFGCGLRSPEPYVRAAPFVAASIAFLAVYRRDPPERFHFLEYGALYVVALHAVTIDVRGPGAYAIAWGITVLLGFADESVQRFTVTRHFDWRDVAMNAAAATSAAAIAAALFARAPERVRSALVAPR